MIDAGPLWHLWEPYSLRRFQCTSLFLGQCRGQPQWHRTRWICFISWPASSQHRWTVEFALQSQHETSSASGMQWISDFNDFKDKSRKRPRSLSLVSLSSSDWEDYGETKVLQRKGLSPKRKKLEQHEDWDIQSNRSGYCELFTFECSVHIFHTWFRNIMEYESNHKYWGYNSY